jgi:hypothetical protein
VKFGFANPENQIPVYPTLEKAGKVGNLGKIDMEG